MSNSKNQYEYPLTPGKRLEFVGDIVKQFKLGRLTTIDALTYIAGVMAHNSPNKTYPNQNVQQLPQEDMIDKFNLNPPVARF